MSAAPSLVPALATLLLAALGPEETKDSVKLNNGRKLEGRVVYEGRDTLRIETGRGETEVEKKNVAEVRSIERTMAEFLERFDKLHWDDRDAMRDLAYWCDGQGLPHEARNMWLRLLILDPGNMYALSGLGADAGAAKPKIEVGKTRVDPKEYIEAKTRWRDAAELRTAHFLVRTDLPLQRILDATVQIERHYRRFYDFFSPDFALYVFEEVPEVQLFSKREDYPLPWTEGANSWFAPGENRLQILVTDQLDLVRIVHDVTDMLIFNALRRSSGKTGNAPSWAIEGFAQYFAATAAPRLGEPWQPLGTPNKALFATAASSAEAVEMKQLLRSSIGELRRGNDATQRSAWAYSLVYYLMHADGGAHRPVFYAQLRAAARGKNIDKTLLESLGTDPDKLHAAVLDYARSNAP
jgi:hypothetical protein